LSYNEKNVSGPSRYSGKRKGTNKKKRSQTYLKVDDDEEEGGEIDDELLVKR